MMQPQMMVNPNMMYVQPQTPMIYPNMQNLPVAGMGGQDPFLGYYGHLNGFQKLERDYGILLKQRSNWYPGCCSVTTYGGHVYPLAEDGKTKKASKILKTYIP